MVRSIVGLGSSLGQRRSNLELGLRGIDALSCARVQRVSRIYESPPMGGAAGNAFLNAAVLLEWADSPRALLRELKELESRLGRQRSISWGDRVFDADILWMENVHIEEDGLVIPHPGLFERNFALWPFADLLGPAHETDGVTTAQRLTRMKAPVAIGVLAG